jgi:hypothetical protein
MKARIWPSFLVCSPVLIFGSIAAAKVFDLVQASVGSAIIGSAMVALMSAVIRQLGVSQETRLFKVWGAPPSTKVMRWRDKRWSQEYKAKMHALIKDKLGIELLSDSTEKEDPKTADKIISEAFMLLRNKLRGNTRILNHQDNIDYGFARNLYGARWLWIFFSVISILILIVFPRAVGDEPQNLELWFAVSYLTAIMFVEWVVMRRHVEHCAFRYVDSAWNYLAEI